MMRHLFSCFVFLLLLSSSFLMAQDQPMAVDEIIVTATKGGKAVEDAPGSVTVITKEEIEKRPSISMSTLLNSIPGFSFRRNNDFTTATPGATIRGISGNRTLVMLDGIPMMAPRTNEIQLDGLSPTTLQRIEAVKGPMSALYSSGMAGWSIQSRPCRRSWRSGPARVTARLLSGAMPMMMS